MSAIEDILGKGGFDDFDELPEEEELDAVESALEDRSAVVGDHIDRGLEAYAKPPAEVDEHAPTKSWGEYVSDYLTVQEMGDKHQWTLGDIVNDMLRATKATGSARVEMITKFSGEVGQKAETVRQYAWVSEAFPKRNDRVTGLSWSHYREAVKMKDAAMAWIDAAVEGNWSVGRLQEEIKNSMDKAAVDNGKPCDCCGNPLPEEGAYFIRRNNKVAASVCSPTCGCAWFYQEAQNEILEKEQAEADKEPVAA